MVYAHWAFPFVPFYLHMLTMMYHYLKRSKHVLQNQQFLDKHWKFKCGKMEIVFILKLSLLIQALKLLRVTIAFDRFIFGSYRIRKAKMIMFFLNEK